MHTYVGKILDLENKPWDNYKKFDGKLISYNAEQRFLATELIQKIR